MKKNGAKTAAFLGIMLAAALVLGYVERLIPLDIAIPGVRIGLPNAVSLIVLKKRGFGTALPFGLLRAVITNLLFGSVTGFAYAAAGAILSISAMAAADRLKVFGVAGQSALGGITHNIGQLAVAAAVLGGAVLYYAPLLIAAGAAAGLITGICAGLSLKYLGNHF